MPPEPLPLSRKEPFAGENAAMAPPDASGGGPAASVVWRDQYHSPSPRRPPSGQQSGLVPSRSEGEGSRVYSSRYGRNSFGRDAKESARRSPWNSGDLPRQQHDFGVGERSLGFDSSAGEANATEERDRDHAISPVGRKPFMWSRSGVFSSKIVRSESDGARVESLGTSGKETPVRSSMMSPLSSDESGARKRQRLGWGQGLAKYEKQKVEGPEDSSGKSVSLQCGDGGKGVVSESSPTLTGLGCPVSPATPSSTTCQRVFEDKLECNIVNNDAALRVNELPSSQSQKCTMKNFSLNLEDVNFNSISSLAAFLADVLQPEDMCSGDSDFTRKTVLDKLVLLKSEILKVLEKTEGEIDSYENKIKSINSELEKDSVKVPLSPPEVVLEKEVCTTSYPSISAPASLETFQKDTCVENINEETNEQPFDWKRSITCKSVKSPFSSQPSVGTSSLTLDSQLVANNGQNDVVHTCSKDRVDGGEDGSLISIIISSNRDSSKNASKLIGLELPAAWPILHRQPSSPIDLNIKERLALRKRYLRFKERILTLKFSAFRYLWEEDVHMLSVMKRRSKSHKRCDVNSKPPQSGSRKHRPSARLPCSSPCNLTIRPSNEVLDRIGKLLSDSEVKVHRSHLKMPALILDKRDVKNSSFITRNGLVEDSCLIEKEKALINPWTAEEKKIFLDKLGIFGKDFRKVASFLEHKTTADCVEFYYKNHKSESFEDVRRILKFKKQSLPNNNYLVPAGKKWKDASNTASLDMLGAVSAFVSHSNWQKFADASETVGHLDIKMQNRNHVKASNSASHTETSAFDVLTGIGNSMSSEGMGSCITTSVDLADKMEILQVDRASYPEVTQTIDEEDVCSDEDSAELDCVDWTDEEKTIFVKALGDHGKDFVRISHSVGTRSKEQCKIFFSKARKCLSLDMVYQGLPINDGGPLCEANEKSDTDDACVAEVDSRIGNIQTCLKVDEFSQSLVNPDCPELPQAVDISQTDLSVRTETGGHIHEEIETKVGKPVSGVSNGCLEAAAVDNSVGIHNGIDKDDDSGSPFGASNASVNAEVKEYNDIIPSGVAAAALEIPVKAEPLLGVDSHFVRPGSHLPGVSFDKLVQRNKCKVKSELQKSGEEYSGGQNNIISTEKHTSAFCQLKTVPGAHDNTGDQESKGISFSTVVFAPHHQNLDQVNIVSNQNSLPLSSKWKGHYAAHANCFLPTIHLDDRCYLPKPSVPSFEDLKYKQQQDTHDKDACQQYVLENQSMAQARETLQILKGKPLRMFNGNGTTGDVVHFDQKTNTFHGLPKKNGKSEAGSPYVPHWPEEKHKDVRQCDQSSQSQLRVCSQVSGAKEQPGRTGDIKLFGKILSHPSVLPKSQENGDKPCYPQNNKKNLKFTNVKIDGTFCSLPADNKGLEQYPARTFGFWDGKSIQTGFSSLPESAIILSKYHAGVSGVAYCPTKDNVSGGGLPNLHHPFLYDGKQQHIFPDVKKTNGFVMMGGGSSLVTANCTDVTDPVVAIKMHYATQARLRGQEEKSWRGDRGGR